MTQSALSLFMEGAGSCYEWSLVLARHSPVMWNLCAAHQGEQRAAQRTITSNANVAFTSPAGYDHSVPRLALAWARRRLGTGLGVTVSVN